MKNTKVSVIVPVYNTEKYLEECLNSLVKQTLQEIQIVIVDDGSNDSSPDIIDRFAKQYPDKITSIRKENVGQGAARNVAFDYCEGEYIGFLDSDDYAKLDMFEKMYFKAEEGKYDCVACGYLSFCMHGEKMVVLEPYHASPQCNNTREMFLGICASSCLHIFRKDVIETEKVRYPEGLIYEDVAFFAKIIPCIKSIAYIEESLIYRRMHEHSTLTTISASRVSQIFGVMDDINNWFNQKKLTEYMELEECYAVRILLCSSIERVALVKTRKERKALVRDTINYVRKNYPDYKKNQYFKHGLKSLYIRKASVFSVSVVCSLMRLKQKMGRSYS